MTPGSIFAWGPSMVRREESPSPLSSNKARPEMVQAVQDHQGDLSGRISAGTAPIVENSRHVPCITLITL